MNINWYPGHMKRTKKLLREQLTLVDIVYELLDARIPLSSKNPDLNRIIDNKPRIVILNKIDLADPMVTSMWAKYFKEQQIIAIPVNTITGDGIRQVMNETEVATKPKMDALAKKGRRQRPVRIMVVGIPNVGKSSLINKLAGKKSTQIGDKPGVTKGKQWIRLRRDMELLDTPGILWPKIGDSTVALNLAFIGAIKDEIMDVETLAYRLLEILWANYREKIIVRYKVEREYDIVIDLMDHIARNRGCVLKGEEIDYLRVSNIILNEFRSATIGRISLEKP
ncbi:MAG: ribosome biogenesis GTPase YlqF [Clostridiales bacterium]|nr:ribosome biogenesis GTPase YlqF [Clostridiales bacterium]